MNAPSDGVEGTLARLVAYPTVSDRPVTALAAYLAERAERAGFRVEVFEAEEAGKANVVCSAGPEGAPGGLVLSGHMDVVPVDGQPWTSDPFRVTRTADRLVGRGTADMKGFVAATCEALDRVDARALRSPLVLVWTHDEEVGCLGSRRLPDQLGGRPLPREALIGEPTSFRVLRMHPGHAAARVRCRGAAAHSSKPDLGRNAILLAARVVLAIDALAAEWSTERRFEGLLARPYPVVNVATVRGGSAINVVPDACEIEVGFRPLPGDDPVARFEALRARVEALAPGDVEAALLRVTPAMLTPEGTALYQALLPYAASPEEGAASFATDGGNFERLGVRSLVFGPGSIDVAHRADEFIPVDELHRAVDVVERLVRARCA